VGAGSGTACDCSGNLYDDLLRGDEEKVCQRGRLRGQKEKIRHDIVNVGKLIRNAIAEGKDGIPAFLENLSGHFDFDRVQVFIKDFDVAKYHYCREGYENTGAAQMKHRENLTIFKGANYSVVSNVHELEYAQPEIYKILLDKHVESMFQYLMFDDNKEITGLVSFDVCSHPVIWNEDVVDSLIVICSVLEALCLF